MYIWEENLRTRKLYGEVAHCSRVLVGLQLEG